MSKFDSTTLTERGIYACTSDSTLIVYIGSTHLSLEDLEDNHRRWREKNHKATYFRMRLEQIGNGWRFIWIQEPLPRTAERIEIEEGALIRAFQPEYNEDMDPYESSIRYGRYERKV